MYAKDFVLLAKRFSWLSLCCGNLIRFILRILVPNAGFNKYIGEYGPYKLHGEFILSNFRHWSKHHNSGFDNLIRSGRSKKCVFDIGAHIGLTSLPLSSQMSSTGILVAFEPSEINRNYLSKHIKWNMVENVVIEPMLVGDKTTDNGHAFYELTTVSGMHSMFPREGKEEIRQLTVPMITLDDYCSVNKLVPDLIKIDVEGAEYLILNGARNTLAKSSPEIFLSVHPKQLARQGLTMDVLKEFVHSFGYQWYSADGKLLGDGLPTFGEYILRK